MASMARRGARGAHSATHGAGRAQLDVPSRHESAQAGAGRFVPVNGTETGPDSLGEPRQGEPLPSGRGQGGPGPGGSPDGLNWHDSSPAGPGPAPGPAPGIAAPTSQDGFR